MGDKVKNSLRDEKHDPVVMSRKRKPVGEHSDLSSKVPANRRGIINWKSKNVDGEDDHSCKAHQNWMQKEYRKRVPNMNIVAQKMKLTFSFRRKMINEGKHSLKDIDGKYPFLFGCDQVCQKCTQNVAQIMTD